MLGVVGDLLSWTHNLFPSEVVGNDSEADLADHGASRGRDLKGRVVVGRQSATIVDDAQQGGDQTNGEDIVLPSDALVPLKAQRSNGDLMAMLRRTLSVMKPIPPMAMVRTWYQPKGTLSISARARRRRSVGSAMWANWLLQDRKETGSWLVPRYCALVP